MVRSPAVTVLCFWDKADGKVNETEIELLKVDLTSTNNPPLSFSSFFLLSLHG